MKKIFLFTLAILFIHAADVAAQSAKYKDYYRSPMDIPLLLSANFAETRTDHFHSGVDIKTNSREGEPLYAVADGYIARMGIIPAGFGRVLYIAHPNGTTTVYGHMQRFTPDMEDYVAAERHSRKLHRIDLYPAADKFPVKKGQLIGYSGNSGSSFGPHLHFELRETASQRTLNIVKLGLYDITDDIKPMIEGLYYVETDTVGGFPVHSEPRRVKVRKVSDGLYALADTAAMEVGPRGYFVLEATDRKNNTRNTMGIYSVEASLDGELYYSFKLDGFIFANTRYVNSLNHYALQKGSRNELLRLAVQEGNKLPIYSGVKNRGLIMLGDTLEHAVTIVAHDDNENASTLSFRIKRRSDASAYVARADVKGVPVDRRKSYNRSGGGYDVTIPAGALYESIFFTHGIDSLQAFTGGKPSPVPCFSDVFTVHSADVPLHSEMTVGISPRNVPVNLYPKLLLARVSDNGSLSSAGGKYANGRVSVGTRRFGRYCVVADTIPPGISASFVEGADLRAVESVAFTLRDNFSGVASFYATIDGRWIPFEQKSNVITHWFDPRRIAYNGNKHKIVITVTDYKGNRTTLERSFVK